MDSPVQHRRSRKIAPVDRVVDEVLPEELNDIENELYQSRKQAENDLKNNSINDKRLSVSEKSISEHFQSCIQLAAENKINPKNAFNFKLIDLLHTMLSKKKQIKDFTEVSSSLDAGVKIYSCRVDNVHSDTLKMATSICASNKQKNEDSDPDDGEPQAGGEERIRKKKFTRRTRKSTLATGPDQINRSKVGEQEGIPHNILSNENFIINSAIFDSNKMCWHLNTTMNFWKSQECGLGSNDSVSIEIPHTAEDAVICRPFKGFQFGEESATLELSIKEKVSMAYDFQMESRNDDFFDDEPLPLDDNRDDTRESEEPRTQVEYLSKMMSSSDFISDISKLILSEKSEYRYFNSQLLQKNWNFKNMRHWNPFKRKREGDEKRVKSDKKELIDFDDLNGFSVFEKKSSVPLTVTYAAGREKYLITPVTHFNINEFFRLNVWREMFVIPTSNTNEEQPSDLEEMINDYDYNNPNDSQNLIPEPYEDDYCDDDNAPTDVHEVMEKTSAFVGDNLVEIPNKVSKIQLPYMVKDKSVNMKNLKSKIWNTIESPEKEFKIEVDEDAIEFSNICKVILFDDTKNSKEELSIPILFNAILQLANDKNLFLFNAAKEDLSDFIVTVSKTET